MELTTEWVWPLPPKSGLVIANVSQKHAVQPLPRYLHHNGWGEELTCQAHSAWHPRGVWGPMKIFVILMLKASNPLCQW